MYTWGVFLTFCLCFSLIDQQEDVSYVAFGGISGSGRGQRSSQPVLGASELPGAQHWEQHDGKRTNTLFTQTWFNGRFFFFVPRSSRFLLFLSCRSASSSVTLTSPPRPPSSPATPTSSPLSHQTPPHFLLRPSAPTQWSTSAGGSPLAENAAPSKCTPPTAWRRSLLKFSPKRWGDESSPISCWQRKERRLRRWWRRRRRSSSSWMGCRRRKTARIRWSTSAGAARQPANATVASWRAGMSAARGHCWRSSRTSSTKKDSSRSETRREEDEAAERGVTGGGNVFQGN